MIPGSHEIAPRRRAHLALATLFLRSHLDEALMTEVGAHLALATLFAPQPTSTRHARIDEKTKVTCRRSGRRPTTAAATTGGVSRLLARLEAARHGASRLVARRRRPHAPTWRAPWRAPWLAPLRAPFAAALPTVTPANRYACQPLRLPTVTPANRYACQPLRLPTVTPPPAPQAGTASCRAAPGGRRIMSGGRRRPPHRVGRFRRSRRVGRFRRSRRLGRLR
jgi:hypothetical protein